MLLSLGRYRLLILSLIWSIQQVLWLTQDQLVRDGDEEGHVGAAELTRGILEDEGILSFLTQAFFGQMGEYPPLFASYLGLWWSLMGEQPESLLVRLHGIPLALLGAWFCAKVGKKIGGDETITFGVILFSPLLSGLSRHYMIENALVCATSFALWLAYTKNPPMKKGILVGFACALGLLTKQSFIVVGCGVLLFLPFRAYIGFFIGSLVCLPWYGQNISQQFSYITQSIQPNIEPTSLISYLAPLGFLCIDICGPIIFVLLIKTFFFKPSSPEKTKLLLWLSISILLFCVLPKKYPRLMIATIVPIALLCGLHGKKYGLALLFGSFIWSSAVSFTALQPTWIQKNIDPSRCPQIWIRAPFPYDLGLSRIAQFAQKHPNTPLIYNTPPTIPCAVQTTHGFIYHLEIYLRRRNVENPLQPKHKQEHGVHISWQGDIRDPQSLQIQ